MKVKVTAKEIRKSFDNIILINYCGLQWLLRSLNANYYTCGIYGWNSDIYVINNNTCIVTGYRPIGNIKPDYNLVKKYNDLAGKIHSKNYSYDQRKTKLEKLLNQFVKEVTTK